MTGLDGDPMFVVMNIDNDQPHMSENQQKMQSNGAEHLQLAPDAPDERALTRINASELFGGVVAHGEEGVRHRGCKMA